jgi:endonuclease/exonuclease/phosphatase family metal-dependent hydrolase
MNPRSLWACGVFAVVVFLAPAAKAGGDVVDCGALDEKACVQEPSCKAAYAAPCTILTSPGETTRCDFAAVPQFISCEAQPTGCAAYVDENSCLSDPSCTPYYTDACASETSPYPQYAACLEAFGTVAATKDTAGEVGKSLGWWSIRIGWHRDVRVLYYNLNWGNNSKYQTLATILLQKVAEGTAPDVVFIQEGFWDEGSLSNPYPLFHQVLGGAYPYQAHGPMRTGFRLFGSGLVVLSRIPFLNTADMVYDACVGVDCFARKGIAMTLLDLGAPCGPVAFFNTHTQAGKLGDYGFLNINPAVTRLQQINAYAAFVRQFTGSTGTVPVIAGGDFNLFAGLNDPSDETSYQILTESLGFVNAEAYCSSHPSACEAPLPIGDGRNTALIAFFRGSTARRMSIVPIEFILHPPSAWGGLSDHSVIESVFRVSCSAVAQD